ncbi:hypothetical protein OAE86_00455 [Akkermansiaceae bacterium]|nr:hypothetical protein [Akkermansiaceae bacterium]
MTIKQLQEWLFNNSQDDQWWLHIDGVSEEDPVTSSTIEEFLKAGCYHEIKALHVSQAGLSPPPWIEIELPLPQPAPAPPQSSTPKTVQSLGQSASPIQEDKTDIFAVITLASGVGSLIILPIIFVPICFICSLVSHTRLKENPNLKGKGVRLVGAICGALGLLWLLWLFDGMEV